MRVLSILGGALALATLGVFVARTRESQAPAAPQVRASDAPPAKSSEPRFDWDLPDRFRPGFDPARDSVPAPRRGGKVTLQIEGMPASLNYLVETSGIVSRLHDEIHDHLVQRSWRTGEFEPRLAKSMVIEDTLLLRDGSKLFGAVREDGDEYEVRPMSGPTHPLREPRRVKKSDVESVLRGTVYTFTLHDGVLWHDGKPLRMEDVLFSWKITKNPGVKCGDKRFQFEPLVDAQALDARTVRFFYAKQYSLATAAFEALVLLPAHVYDLRDPLNPKHDANATDEQEARWVNENEANRKWIGLGPYRVTEFNQQWIEAARFDGYFDKSRAGWVDAIRWRFFSDDHAALLAMREGQLDFMHRVVADDYFGPATNDETFTSRFYKGWYYTPRMSYVAWNGQRPQFADPRVRRALAMSFDWDDFIKSFYSGLAQRVTSEASIGSLNYNHDIVPVPFDPAGATKLFAEAGWIDRDGDGVLDRDGKPFEFDLLMQGGNRPSLTFAQKLQESFKRVGVRMGIAEREWAALLAMSSKRDFDAMLKAWSMPPENDPEQAWHSRWAGPGTANTLPVVDADVDRWIDAMKVELDPVRRGALAHELYARLYELQPYLYGVTVPNKFALSKRVRNFRTSSIDPGYSIRDWWIVDE